MSDAYENNYMTDESDTRWVKLAYANRLIEQAEQRITDLECRNGELERALRDVSEWGANASAHLESLTSEPSKTIVFEMPDDQSVQLLESMRPGFNVGIILASALLDELPALTQHPQGESNEQQ